MEATPTVQEASVDGTGNLLINIEQMMKGMGLDQLKKDMDELKKMRNDDIAELKKMREEISEITHSLAYTEETSNNAVQKAEAVTKKTDALEEEVEELKANLKHEKEERLKLECQLRRKNLIITGISEDDEEKDDASVLRDKVLTILTGTLKVQHCELDRCYRLGGQRHNITNPSNYKGKRPVLITFNHHSQRDLAWMNRRFLKNTTYIIKEDLPEEIESKARRMTPILQEARRQNLKAMLVRDTLILNGTKYTESNISMLPDCLKPEAISCKVTKDQYYFWGGSNPLSNFHKCDFQENDVSFTSVEQYFVYKKAHHFSDEVAKQKVLTLQDPVQIKRTMIKGYDKAQWAPMSERVMEQGLSLKFHQDEGMKKALLATEHRELIEASPYDSMWGIGIGLHSESLTDKTKWGSNRLGKLLMEIRERLVT